MTGNSPITRFIGEAERTLQALLQRQLQKAGVSFPEWVALTILSAGPLGGQVHSGYRRRAGGTPGERNERRERSGRERSRRAGP